MTTTVVNQGFPNSWISGKFEADIIDKVSENINTRWPTQQNLVINTTWAHTPIGRDAIKSALLDQPDNIFLACLTDPLSYSIDALTELIPNIDQAQQFGYSKHNSFDFWAIAVKKTFVTYTEQQLEFGGSKVFMSLNRNPHPHRVKLAERIKQQGLDSVGIMTLGHDNQLADDQADPANSIHSYSLVNLDLWRQHFVTVVNETEFNQHQQIFVTEKTWRPILGMRPFLINSHPKILDYLESHGFDVFRDVWPIVIDPNADAVYPVTEVHDYIINNLTWLQTQDLNTLYQRLKPRLIKNRQRFFEFASEQEQSINKIFLC